MKKNILIIVLAIILQSTAQTDEKIFEYVNMINNTEIISTSNPQSMVTGDDILWSEDFSDSTNPNITTEDIAGLGDWRWSDVGPSGNWSNGQIIQSETPGNGFMMMEADFYNSSPQNGVGAGETGENVINATFTIGPIDLSSSETNELVLQFYSNYRVCCYYSPADFPNATGEFNDLEVFISVDGGSSFANLNYIEGETYEVNELTEKLSQIPLGSFSPVAEEVYFKFEWTGSHYHWMIDDLSIIQRPAFDLKMQSAWLTMEDPASVEYYAIPKSQMPNQMLIGAEIYNYGYSNENEVILNGMIEGQGIYTTLNYNETIDPDSTVYIESDYFDISMLEAGNYTFTADITSTGNDVFLDDNAISRDFLITENIYALDGLYTNNDLIGTGVPGGDVNADGVKIANYFDIKQNTILSAIRMDLYGGTYETSLGTFENEPGGEIVAYVCDTTGIFDPAVTELSPDLGGIIWMSDFYLVTQDDVANQEIIIDADEFELPTGAYYVVVELYSNGLLSDIIILDDTSVPQPWFASLRFDADAGTWYSSPNAASIQIGLDGFEFENNSELSEEALQGIQCFPNPVMDYIEITSDEFLNGDSQIIIYNILGEEMLNFKYSGFGNKQEISLEGLASGSYVLEFAHNSKISKHKLIIE